MCGVTQACPQRIPGLLKAREKQENLSSELFAFSDARKAVVHSSDILWPHKVDVLVGLVLLNRFRW